MFNNSKGCYQEERISREDGWKWDRSPSSSAGPQWVQSENASTSEGADSERSPRNPYVNDVWASDDGEKWVIQTKGAEWSRRAGHQVAIVNDVMYVVGGHNATHAFNDMWSSLDKGRTWEQIMFPSLTDPGDYSSRIPEAAWSPRKGFTMEVKTSPSLTDVHTLYIYGGELETGVNGTGEYEVTNEVWMWPVVRNYMEAVQWLKVEDGACGRFSNRSHMMSMTVDGEVMIAGGHEYDGHQDLDEERNDGFHEQMSEMWVHEQVLPQTCLRKEMWVVERQWAQSFVPPCPNGWYQVSPFCYWIKPEPMSAIQAEATCQAEGAHTASVTSEKEHDFLFALLKDLDNELSDAHIGVRRTKSADGSVEWSWSDGSVWYYRRWAQNEPNEDFGNLETIAGVNTVDSAPAGEDCATIRFKRRSKKFDAWVNMDCGVQGVPACKRNPENYQEWLDHQLHIMCDEQRRNDDLRYLQVGRCYSELGNSFWVTAESPKTQMYVCLGKKDCSCLDWHRRTDAPSVDFGAIEDYTTETGAIYPLTGEASGGVTPVATLPPAGKCNPVRLDPPTCVGFAANGTQCMYTGFFKPNSTYSHMLNDNLMEANHYEANTYENTTFRYELTQIRTGYGRVKESKLYQAELAIKEAELVQGIFEKQFKPGEFQWLVYSSYYDTNCGDGGEGVPHDEPDPRNTTKVPPSLAFQFGGRPSLPRDTIENISHRAIGMCYQLGRWGPSERFECHPTDPDGMELVKYATEDCGGLVLRRLEFVRGKCLSSAGSADAPAGMLGGLLSELQSDGSTTAMSGSRRVGWSGQCQRKDYTKSAYSGDHCGHFIAQFGNTTRGYRKWRSSDTTYSSEGSHACSQQSLKEIVCDVLRHPSCIQDINSCECLTLKYKKIGELQRNGHYDCARNALCVGATKWADDGAACCKEVQMVPIGNCIMLCEYEIKFKADGLLPLNGKPKCSTQVCKQVDTDLPYPAVGTGFYVPGTGKNAGSSSTPRAWLLAAVWLVGAAAAAPPHWLQLQ
jgi:hypothetical protein